MVVNDKRTELKWVKPTKSAFEWAQHAHKHYITARFLYWKNFPFQSALLGAHAMELYMKAFLIHKIGKYPSGHFLDAIYRECMKYDQFFNNESLSSSFLSGKRPRNNLSKLWRNYTELLRYPEPLTTKPLPEKVTIDYTINSAGTCETLDSMAYFIYDTIQPLNVADGENVIDEVLAGCGYRFGLGFRENIAEIKALFLRDNHYFTSPKP